ncbi:cation:proton antiporter [Streptomyces sp. NPDC047928]|uniref:cation:proton antiporter domain-containing protein n=1 Tax=unclassified Streptomyces TaxID=2593676 RepID=UPI003716A097
MSSEVESVPDRLAHADPPQHASARTVPAQPLSTDSPTGSRTGGRRARSVLVRTGLAYAALVVVPIVLAVLALRHGSGLEPGTGTGTGAAPAAGGESGASPGTGGHAAVFPKLLTAVPVIMAACYLTGRLFRRVGQPPVIGEIFAGILLGPSVLGLVWPDAAAWLLPGAVLPALGNLAEIGLVFFMFLVGRELDLRLVRQRGRTALLVSHASIALPFLCGLLLALAAYGPLAPAKVGFGAFALFLAVAMSVTAFPVLARILAERRLNRTPLGATALTCAAIDDVTAWCLLSLVVALVNNDSPSGAAVTFALALAFFAVMTVVVRPLLHRLMVTGGRGGRRIPEGAVLPVLLGGVMLSAYATDAIGIHSIFGAFVFGVITPRTAPEVDQATHQMARMTTTLLLPLFFVHTGLRTEVGLLAGDAGLWAWCGLIILAAFAGKLAGGALAARAAGVGARESLSLGVLMNCRGLTELVILNIGLDLGVITPVMFTMLVLMALVSTVLTSPALSLIDRWGRRPARR